MRGVVRWRGSGFLRRHAVLTLSLLKNVVISVVFSYLGKCSSESGQGLWLLSRCLRSCHGHKNTRGVVTHGILMFEWWKEDVLVLIPLDQLMADLLRLYFCGFGLHSFLECLRTSFIEKGRQFRPH
jgi:hypothetical protein